MFQVNNHNHNSQKKCTINHVDFKLILHATKKESILHGLFQCNLVTNKQIISKKI